MVDIPNFEPNSHKYRATKTETEEKKPVIEKAIVGEAKIRRPSLVKRFIGLFFAGNIKDVKRYLFYDVFIPAARDTMSNLISKGGDMILFGESNRSSKRTPSGTSYTNYGVSYRQNRDLLPSSTRNSMSRRFDDIQFDNKGDAELARDTIVDIVAEYGRITVGEFYQVIGIKASSWTENVDDYGWKDISGMKINSVRDGYVIEMPKCIRLN